MKILQINSHYNAGGAGKIVAYLHHQLMKSGHESVVIYGRGETVEEPGVYRVGSEMSNRLDALATRIIGNAGFQSWSATKEIMKIIEKNKPDLLHLHVLHGYYLNYPILFEYINKQEIPCVWTFHDCLAFTGKCGYPYDCKKYIDGCHNCTRLRDYPTTYGLDLTKSMWKKKKALFEKTDNKIIVSPSDWMTSMAKSSFFAKYECLTIHNGIDTNKTFIYRDQKSCRKELGFNEDAPIALGVAFGQENPRKGVKYIIQTAKDMPQIQFVLIGWKNTKDTDISKLPNVYTRAFISNQEELAKYYAAADVFLLPSLAENYATTSIEALACGTPIIGFDVGGIPEQANGIFGETVKVGDQVAFEEKIEKRCNPQFRNDACRKEISEYVRAHNSMERMFADYYGVYTKLCAD